MTDIRLPAKKSLGQNFLVNPHVLDAIIRAADIRSGETVVEVGPGTGALTERLAATGAQVICIEKDRRLIDPLREKFSGSDNVTIIEGDILEIDVSGLLHDAGYKVVANIPYYLTSHLLRLMLTGWPRPRSAVLMVQEEVARRMMAQPPEMNLLALSVQLYARPDMVAKVGRNSFRPVPDVDSAVILLTISSDADLKLNELILATARRAFGQKRKKLSATIPVQSINAAGLDPNRRPQELSLADWQALVRKLP